MSSHHTEQWQRLFNQKRHKFLEEDCGNALNIESFDDLQKCLQELTNTYSRTTFPGIIERLRPSLLHIESFTRAITSASQYSPVACIVWGSVQAVVQSACASAEMLDETLTLLSEVNDAIPLFESYLVLFPDSIELQYPLQDIFDDYVDFCLDTVAYMKHRGSYNFLRFFWTSKPTALLEQTRVKIQKHFNAFKQAAELAHRRRTHLQHLRIERTLASNPLQMWQDARAENQDLELQFPVSTVTLFRNYTFQGRKYVFDQIHETFAELHHEDTTLTTKEVDPSRYRSGSWESPACCVIHGLGGIGKTQTALEYTYRNRDKYDAIFWIQSEQVATIAGDYAAIAEKLHLVKSEGPHEASGQGRAVKRVSEWLQNTRRKWLIVFDNVEDINDLNAYLPTKTTVRGHVILTTQHPDFFAITDVFKLIRMANLDREEGSKLLFQHLQRDPHDEEEAEAGKKISDTLDGLPLAIATIGGYINASETSTADFLTDMETSSNAWEAGSTGPVTQYEKTLQTVFKIALQELPPRARDLINILSFLNPDSIPENLFLSDMPGGPSYKRAELTDVIRILRRRQLIHRDTSGSERFISIHRTVQWNILLDLSKDYDHRWEVFKNAFDLVQRNLPESSKIDIPQPEAWTQFERYVPQILSLRSHCLWPDPPVALPEEFAKILSDMGTYMWHAGLMAQGYDALKTAEKILDDKNALPEHPLRGKIHEHIGIIASFCGVSRRQEAMDRRYKALDARRAYYYSLPAMKTTMEDEISLFNPQSDMAFGLMQLSHYDESEKWIELCHEQYKKWGTPDDIPFEYLKYHHITSYIRMSQKRPVTAIRHCKNAAKLGEKCAGVEHPMTQLCRFTLTNHLYLAGELQKAITLSDSVLQARSKVCGEFNQLTLDSHAMCGFLRYENGELDKAEYHFAKCLDRSKRSSWNPEAVARAQYIYSRVLEKLGKREESVKILNEACLARDHFLRLYPDYVKPDPDDMVVFDQIVCLWSGRFTGPLAQHGSSNDDNLHDIELDNLHDSGEDDLPYLKELRVESSEDEHSKAV